MIRMQGLGAGKEVGRCGECGGWTWRKGVGGRRGEEQRGRGDWEGAMGRGRRAMRRGRQGGGNREGDTGRGRRGVGDWEGDDGEGGNGVGEMERGATGRGRWGGAKGRGRRGRWQRGGGEQGARGGGISQMDMKCLGGHMECLCGTRLQSFLTLFTRATPGTPASSSYIQMLRSCNTTLGLAFHHQDSIFVSPYCPMSILSYEPYR